MDFEKLYLLLEIEKVKQNHIKIPTTYIYPIKQLSFSCCTYGLMGKNVFRLSKQNIDDIWVIEFCNIIFKKLNILQDTDSNMLKDTDSNMLKVTNSNILQDTDSNMLKVTDSNILKGTDSNILKGTDSLFESIKIAVDFLENNEIEIIEADIGIWSNTNIAKEGIKYAKECNIIFKNNFENKK